MAESGAEHGDRGTFMVVRQARARLARIAGRELLRRRAWWVIGAGAALAACRPFVLPLAVEAPRWVAVARSVELFAAGAGVAAAALVALGRRRGASEVGAARAIDEALGTPEVVASGLAFARDGREEPETHLARRRAAEAAAGVRVEALFPLPGWRPSGRAAARFALCAAAAVAVGSYDPGLVRALVAPPTASENEAAADLEEAARELVSRVERGAPEVAREMRQEGREKADDKGGERGPALADAAREAARAAKRGDRKGALEKLEGVRATGAKEASRAAGLRSALRRMAEALAPPEGKHGAASAAKAAAPGEGAAESMRLLAKKMRSEEGSGGEGEQGASSERVLERLERAGEEARRAASEEKDKGASEAARALSRAAESLRRGDREAAARELEEAASRAEAMEQARDAAAAEAMAIAEMLEKSGALERAIQMALLGREGAGEKGETGLARGEGREGENGEPGGRAGAAAALRSAILARLAAMGMTPPDGDPGTGSGPHMPDRQRAHHEPIAASGSIQAPSQVTEGARAIQAIRGLGRGTDPPASYREVFPAYDAAAEEGIADERVPAGRRAAVRRYFQSIRPDPR